MKPAARNLIHALLLPAALALSAAAFAADPAPAAAAATPATDPAKPAGADAKATTSDAKTAAAAKAAAQSQAAKECASTTGTRLRKDKGQCNNNKVTVYTQDEIQSTGRIDMGEALKQLDPRFQ